MIRPELDSGPRATTIALARQHLHAAEELLTAAAEDGALAPVQCLNAGRGIQVALEATAVQVVDGAVSA